MIKPGICSITLRKKSPEELIALSAKAGLIGIEWGSDVHVPAGDLENARRVGDLTRAAGLEVAGYGSYWFAFDKEPQPAEFLPLIETAAALGAPVIRIWAGSLHLEKNPEYFRTVVEQSRAFADAAAHAGIKIAYEFHPNTFTETPDGALKLINAVSHPNLYTYWQPRHGSHLDERLKDIVMLKDRLLHLHVFHWSSDSVPYTRLPLAEGREVWPPCLQAANPSGKECCYALLEFVLNDNPDQLLQDAAVLKNWLSQI